MRSLITVDTWVCFFAALIILILPLDWFAAALCAALFHESCHALAIILLGGRIMRIHIGIRGAVIDTEIPDRRGELIASLAGPFGSLFLLALCHWFPKLSICACIQGLFNFLPVLPLDGGRALRCVLELLHIPKGECILKFVEILTFISLLFFSAVGTIMFSLGILPLFTVLVLIIKTVFRKRPCKQSQIRVQ